MFKYFITVIKQLIIERRIKRKNIVSNTSFLYLIIKGGKSLFIGIKDNSKGQLKGYKLNVYNVNIINSNQAE